MINHPVDTTMPLLFSPNVPGLLSILYPKTPRN